MALMPVVQYFVGDYERDLGLTITPMCNRETDEVKVIQQSK